MKQTILFILFTSFIIGCKTNNKTDIDRSIVSLDSLISIKYSELRTNLSFKLRHSDKVLSEFQNQFLIVKGNFNGEEPDKLKAELESTKKMIDTLFSSNTLFINEISATNMLLSVNENDILEYNVRAAELIILDKILNECTKNEFVFNKYKVIVIPGKTNVKLNALYHAKIYLAAYDSTYNPEVLISAVINDEKKLLPIVIEDGAGLFNVNTSEKGPQEWHGVYRIKSNSNSKTIEYPFSFEFQVE